MSGKYMKLGNGVYGLTLTVGHITTDGYGQKIIRDDSGYTSADGAVPYDAEKERLINKLIAESRRAQAFIKENTRYFIEELLKI